MLKPMTGNLLEADAEALVNTVNTVGIMGKGIALQFKQAFPANFKAYKLACDRGQVQLGHMFVVPTAKLENPRYIINFPTKKHWKSRTRLDDVEAGLRDLVRVIEEYQIKSIAVPPLGCGNGGLDWRDVRPMIERALGDLDGVEVLVFSPEGAPAPDAMPVGTTRPRMTPGRAAVVALLTNYLLPGYHATMLEMEKLTYLLQSAGEPLRLRFAKGQFGPYAENLHHSLQSMEGHFIRGYGDRTAGATIKLLPGAVEEANRFLAAHPDSERRQRKVARLIDGFETPYLLELLATVHWVAAHESERTPNADEAVAKVHAWDARKRRIFSEDHIHVAWERLNEEGWLTGADDPDSILV